MEKKIDFLLALVLMTLLKKVSDLIDASRMEWKIDHLSLHFNDRDQQHIFAIPFSVRAPKDSHLGIFKGWIVYNENCIHEGCTFRDFSWGVDDNLGEWMYHQK